MRLPFIYCAGISLKTGTSSERQHCFSYMAVGQLNKFYSGLKHILCYILLGRRKEEIKWLKSQFESHGIEPIKLKNNEVDNFLISSAEAGKYSDNREASSILASQWLKNQVLELGCPPMEAWVHRDM